MASYRKRSSEVDFRSYFNLNILREKKATEDVILNYRKAIELRPDFADAYFNLGNILRLEEEVDGAILNYRKAIEVKPDFADVYLNLVTLLMDERRSVEARELLRHAHRIEPSLVSSLAFAAMICSMGKDFADSIYNLSW